MNPAARPAPKADTPDARWMNVVSTVIYAHEVIGLH